MRLSLVRLANAASKAPFNLIEASAMLYPPIPLYRRLLRAHRNLPSDMRSLGDDYVKSEFRRHKDVTNPVYIMGFLSQWKMYLDQMPSSINFEYKGKKLDATIFEKMSEEQIRQLYDLMHAAKGVWKLPPSGSRIQRNPEVHRDT